MDPLFCVTVFTFALIAIIGVCVLLLKVRINNNKNLRIHIEKYYWNLIMNIGILKRTDKYRRIFRPVHKVSTLIRNKNEIYM